MTLQGAVVLALQASILMTVFGFGLAATLDDVLYFVRRPGLLGRSLIAMFLVMPVVAVALVRTFELRPSIEIVLVALSVSPIPPLLPGRGQKAGGHAPYALGLMAIVGTLSIVVVPLSVLILGRYFGRSVDMSSAAVARVALMSVVVPLAVGMGLRAVAPALADRVAKPLGLVAKTLLAAGLVGLLAGVGPAAIALIGNGTIAAFVLFVAAGLAVGHWLGGPMDDHRLVLALATATRHPAIALTVARANFPDEPNLAAGIVLYLLVNLLIGLPYQVWRSRQTLA